MKSAGLTFSTSALRAELQEELTGNILPFWMDRVVDDENGGFYGALTNDLRIDNEVPRSAVLCARILWTYSAAYRILGSEEYLSMARHAYDYLTQVFWDPDYGGLYWSVDRAGKPVDGSKRNYAQAFGIYGLAEYHRATGERASLDLVKELYGLVEEHAHDAEHGGYIEGGSRRWEEASDLCMSHGSPRCTKSMNTMLHLLEAFTHLLRAWDDPLLKVRHRKLLDEYLLRVVDSETNHLLLFFDRDWRSLSDRISFGHDIEASWLLQEAAEMHADRLLLEKVRAASLLLAESVLAEGLDEDGSVYSEAGPGGLTDSGRDWWSQAEAMVGFYNAYQVSAEPRFAEAAYRCWVYVKANMVDRKRGEWLKRLRPDGSVDDKVYKAGPWECPYHHARACFEMMGRLAG